MRRRTACYKSNRTLHTTKEVPTLRVPVEDLEPVKGYIRAGRKVSVCFRAVRFAARRGTAKGLCGGNVWKKNQPPEIPGSDFPVEKSQNIND